MITRTLLVCYVVTVAAVAESWFSAGTEPSYLSPFQSLRQWANAVVVTNPAGQTAVNAVTPFEDPLWALNSTAVKNDDGAWAMRIRLDSKSGAAIATSVFQYARQDTGIWLYVLGIVNTGGIEYTDAKFVASTNLTLVTSNALRQYIDAAIAPLASTQYVISATNTLASRAYVDAATNAIITVTLSSNQYVSKAGDTMTGMLTTPSNRVIYGMAVGSVPIPRVYGAHNMGHDNNGAMSVGNFSFGAHNIGENRNTMSVGEYSAGAQNLGKSDSAMVVGNFAHGAQNAGQAYGTMYVGERGGMNRGTINPGNVITNTGIGTVALHSGVGNIYATNNACIILGAGYTSRDREIVADQAVLRVSPSVPQHAATKAYVDSTTNQLTGLTITVQFYDVTSNQHVFVFTNGLLQAYTLTPFPQ